MPAIARPRSARSLSPSLLPNAPHRYIPYHRINSTYSFGLQQPSTSPEEITCDRMSKMHLAGRCQQQRPALPPFNPPPARPTAGRAAPAPTHRRTVSLNSIPHVPSQGYILFPHPRRRQRAPASLPLPIRRPSPPLTPIVESPLPQQQLMLVTPHLATFLKQGGSVSVRGADGKIWRARAPVPAASALVSPTFGMRMMRM